MWFMCDVLLQPRERGNTRFHKIHNVQIALNFLSHKRVGLSLSLHRHLSQFIVTFCHHEIQWVTLCFAKTKVLNSSFKPNIGLKPN